MIMKYSVPGFPGRLLFFLICWGCCWGEMLETPWLSPPKSWTFVPEETLASSDKEVELEIAVGNILPLKKNSNRLGMKKKRRKKRDTMLYSLVLVYLFVFPILAICYFGSTRSHFCTLEQTKKTISKTSAKNSKTYWGEGGMLAASEVAKTCRKRKA